MSRSLIQRLALPAAFATMPLSPWAAPAPAAAAQTVCTITVNSPDEKEALRRHLPGSKYRFVELVERGRPDWLASSCRAGVTCDLLVISGHYDGGNEFFSDQLEVQEYLPVDELERVSCSDSCPGLFSRLKEVYLFGCNTLNPQPQSSASSDIVRSLVREGHAPKQAQRELQSLAAAHGESSRDRMRQIFKDVPVIYGFSSSAPLGPIAASTLERYLHGSGDREIGRGHPSGRLLGYFAPFSMAATQGMTDEDPHLQARQDMCHFTDTRLPLADKLGFVHQLLQRHTAEARLYLDRILRLTSSLDAPLRQQPAVARVLDGIAGDAEARGRWLEDARVAEPATARMRMLDLARDLGWLSEDGRWEELALMLGVSRQSANKALRALDLRHAGPAIVGEMGYERAAQITAIGDTVNTASRLETLTKEFGVELVVSQELLDRAGIGLDDAALHNVEIRGRQGRLAVRAVKRAGDLTPMS